MSRLAPVLSRFGIAHVIVDQRGGEHVSRMLPRHACIVSRIPALDRAHVFARSVRERSLRAGVYLLLVRRAVVAGDVARARDFADAIEPALTWQRGQLALARGYFENGSTTEALRIIRRVRDHRLLGERQVLLAEIRLVVRPNTEAGVGAVASYEVLRNAVPSPAWTEIAPQPDAKTREHLMMATAWARLAARTSDRDSYQRATYHLVDAGTKHRRTLFEIMARSGVHIRESLIAMRVCRQGGIVDAYLAAYVAWRAERIGEAPVAFTSGITGGRPTSNDARSLERALFDEGLALSSAAPQRRRVLISTAQTCLRSAIAEPDSWSQEVIESRLRTLVHLGGTLGRDVITKTLDSHPLDASTFARAIDALCVLDATVAARITLTRLVELDKLGVDIERVVEQIEVYRGVPNGFAHAFDRTCSNLRRQGISPYSWLDEFVQVWRASTGTLPDTAVMICLAERDVPATPSELSRDVDRATQLVFSDGHERILDGVAEPGVLEALLLSRPARVDWQMRAWTLKQWRALFEKLRARSDFVEHTTLVECAKLLGLSSYAPLRTGNLDKLGVMPQTFGEYRLRLLDKRYDLLAYLRFADIPARSCYRSDSRYYTGAPFTQTATFDVWKDPLAFCFHIERGGTPCGFLFGNFGRVRGKPAVLVNSLHVRPKTIRIPAIRAFEAAIAPLGIAHIGVANAHGGRGELPPEYEIRAERFLRLRALGRDHKLVTSAYDDISRFVNLEIERSHLYWRAS